MTNTGLYLQNRGRLVDFHPRFCVSYQAFQHLFQQNPSPSPPATWALSGGSFRWHQQAHTKASPWPHGTLAVICSAGQMKGTCTPEVLEAQNGVPSQTINHSKPSLFSWLLLKKGFCPTIWMHFMETIECKMNSLPWWMAKRKSCNCPAVWETVWWPGKQRLELSNRNNRKDGLQFREFCPGIIFSHGPMTLKTCPEQTLKELRSKQTETKAGAEYVETIECSPHQSAGTNTKNMTIGWNKSKGKSSNIYRITCFDCTTLFCPAQAVRALQNQSDFIGLKARSIQFGTLWNKPGTTTRTTCFCWRPCRVAMPSWVSKHRGSSEMKKPNDNKNMVCFTLKTESHRLIVWVTCDHTSMAIWWPCDCMPSPLCHLNRSYCGRSSRKRPMSFLLFMCCWEKIRGKVATFNRWTSARDNVPINRSIIQLKW